MPLITLKQTAMCISAGRGGPAVRGGVIMRLLSNPTATALTEDFGIPSVTASHTAQATAFVETAHADQPKTAPLAPMIAERVRTFVETVLVDQPKAAPLAPLTAERVPIAQLVPLTAERVQTFVETVPVPPKTAHLASLTAENVLTIAETVPVPVAVNYS